MHLFTIYCNISMLVNTTILSGEDDCVNGSVTMAKLGSDDIQDPRTEHEQWTQSGEIVLEPEMGSSWINVGEIITTGTDK